jgi:hypothetical protein
MTPLKYACSVTHLMVVTIQPLFQSGTESLIHQRPTNVIPVLAVQPLMLKKHQSVQ